MTEGIETVEEVVKIAKNNPLVLVGMGVTGVAIGAIAGYQWAKRSLTIQYREIIDKEIEQTKNFYAAVNKTEYPTPAHAVEALQEKMPGSPAAAAGEALRGYKGQNNRVVYDKIGTPNLNPVAVALRDTDNPYVITYEEFFNNEDEYEQATMTWYESDETLADEREEVVPNVLELIGPENLERFGEGSNDPNVVYIRNESRREDYEIIRSQHSYAEHNLGLEKAAPKTRREREGR